MLKKEFLDKVAENAGLYKYQAYMFWKAFEEVLIEVLRQGEKIKIDCFGTFYTSELKEYKITNTIAKNSESQVPAQKRIRLKPSKMIKRKLNSKGIEENE